MENSIMTIERNPGITVHKFKSATIAAQVKTIAEAMAKADSAMGKIREEYDKAKDEAYKAIAPVVASLKANNAHKTEGFKTFPEFAKACLPISERQIPTLLAYQKKIADVPALKEFTVSNVEAIAPADAVAIKNAIESGELSKETPQKQLKEFAQAHPRAATGSGRPTVVPEFTVKAVVSGLVYGERVIKEDFCKVTGYENITMLPKPENGTPRRFIAYNGAGEATMFEFSPYVKPTATKPKAKEQSVYDQLREQFDFMADWTDEQIAATLRQNADKAKGK